MTETPDKKPPERGKNIRPNRNATWFEHGYVEANGKRVAETAAREFRGANPNTKSKFVAAALGRAAKASDRHLRKLLNERDATDAIDTVISNEWFAKPHWTSRVAGFAVGIIGVGLMIPLPLVVGAGIEESLLIEKVIDQPLVALLYGGAPIAAPLATHGMRDALKSDRARRRFDYVVYLTTLGAFAAWAWNFGPTFLIDILSDPSAAANAGTLADFYRYHLVLEVSGAASAYLTAMHLLTSGAKRVSRVTEAHELLETAVATEIEHSVEIARQRDLVAAGPDQYGSAQQAYQDHAVLKSELAQRLFAAQSGSEALQMLAELKATLETDKKDEDDV